VSESSVRPVDGDGLVKPSAIPFVDSYPSVISDAADQLRSVSSDVAVGGMDVERRWAPIGESYDAPGRSALLSALDPVTESTSKIASNLLKVSSILGVFATEIEAPRRKLLEIKQEAEQFTSDVRNGVRVDFRDISHPYYKIFGLDMLGSIEAMGWPVLTIPWSEHASSQVKNADLIERINRQVVRIDNARVDCINDMRRLHDDVICRPGEEKLSLDQLNQPNTKLPWGEVIVEKRTCFQSVGDGIDRAGNSTVKSMFATFGLDWEGEDNFDLSWDTFVEQWKGTGETLGGIGVTVLTLPASFQSKEELDASLPDWYSDVNRWGLKQNQEMVEGVVGSKDEWKANPAEAAGFAVFNLLTIVVDKKTSKAKDGVKTEVKKVLKKGGVSASYRLLYLANGLESGATKANEFIDQLTKDIERSITAQGKKSKKAMSDAIDRLNDAIDDLR
jgi:hypothetical protein